MTDILAAVITTLGALAGSFGGFTLAARAQRRQADRDDARARRDAAEARATVLEDERHEFQLTTLLALQELTRKHTRAAILTVEQDRKTIADGLGYRLLAIDDHDDFANAIEFGHHIARVTSAELRTQLEKFSAMCAEYSLPPHSWQHLDREQSLSVQGTRAFTLIQAGTEVASLIGEHLRREIDRHSNSPANQE